MTGTAREGPRAQDVEQPFASEMQAERTGWYELVALVGSLAPDERMRPGYYSDPEWSVRDLIAHLGTWLAEAQVQFERMTAGTYDGHDVDVDALNVDLLTAMDGQPWTVAWTQANAGRTMMLEAWYALIDPTDEAGWWIRKCAAQHFAEHLPRLREWVEELASERAR